MQAYDLIVIGSGPAGRRAAVQAAKLKKSVLVIEKGRRVGGVCVHTGTIPSKTLRETVLNLSGWRERGFYGRGHRNKQTITAEDLRTRLSITLDHEVEVLEHQFSRNGVSWVRGEARFIDPLHVSVATDTGEQRLPRRASSSPWGRSRIGRRTFHSMATRLSIPTRFSN
jgi:NAD(P) transhydrogenase